LPLAGAQLSEREAVALVWKRPHGAKITEIYEGSPAEKAELKLGDIVISLNSKNVEGEAEALKKSQIYAKTGGVFPLSL
jgi:S1-C subfamily serine protease